MAKLLASFVFILLVVNSKCLIEIELVEREISSDSADSRQLDDVVTRIVHTVIDNFDEYVAGRDETHVEYLEEQRNVNGAITYTLGARLPGDSLVAHGGHNQSWPSPQNVATTLSYPTSGVGAQVTYVAIQVNQSTNLGRAYILKGGLHQRSISIVVEAYGTLYLNYVAAIYGA